MTRRRLLLSGAAALLYFLSFPPAGLGLLGFVALVPLHFAVRGAGARASALLGWTFGFASSLLLFAWLLHVDVVAVHHLLLFAAYLGLYAAPLAVLWSKLADRSSALALVPALAVALDWARGHAGFLACPWLTSGQTQHANVPLLQIASVAGEPAVALIVVAANVAVAQLATRAPSLRTRAAVALAIAALAHPLGWVLEVRGDGRMIPVAVVQPNFAPGSGDADAFSRLDDLTREAAKTRPLLVVWPESAAGDIEGDVLALFQARAIVDRSGVNVLFGSSSARRDAAGHNSLFLMRPSAPMSEPYRKVRLLPFGEYAPPGLPPSVGPRLFDTVPGASRRTFDLDGIRIEPLICFESLFADDVRATASAEPSLIAVAVNDGWFGKTAAPELHNLVGAFRAVENRRPVVIASNSGPSQIFDANGRVVARSMASRPATISATVRVDVAAGLYRRWGDWVWFVALSALALLVLAASRPWAR